MSGPADTAQLLVAVGSGQSRVPRTHDLQQGAGTLHVLGHACFGSASESLRASRATQHVNARPLYPAGDFFEERWLSRQSLCEFTAPGVHGRYNDDLFFGVIELAEPQDSPHAAPPLERAALAAYRLLFETLDSSGFTHLWRAWNYMADINLQTHGMERYRQFNMGRQQGFTLGARSVTGNVPAACAIGLRSGPLSVAFLAGRGPTVPVENPRQISACHYPAEYGKRPPTFARAGLARLAGQEWLLLSGTASIVGHQTVHAGDVRQQVGETLANIEAVIAEANRLGSGQRAFHLHDFQFRVYVRHAGDVAVIRGALAARLLPAQSVLFLHADICRSDLDVEIEGAAWRPAAEAE